MRRSLALGVLFGLGLGWWAWRWREQRRVRRLIDGKARRGAMRDVIGIERSLKYGRVRHIVKGALGDGLVR